jgi:hypothetical protein
MRVRRPSRRSRRGRSGSGVREELRSIIRESVRRSEAGQKAITGVQIEGYDELNVGEIVERLDNLSAEELQRVRAYEQRNKNRDTLLKQIDRRINAAS